MWPSDLAPNDSNFGSSDFLLCAVDVCDSLTKVEAEEREYQLLL